MMFYDVLWCSMMFCDVLWCFWCSMFVLWCFYVIRAFSVYFCWSVPPEFLRSFVIFSLRQIQNTDLEQIQITIWWWDEQACLLFSPLKPSALCSNWFLPIEKICPKKKWKNVQNIKKKTFLAAWTLLPLLPDCQLCLRWTKLWSTMITWKKIKTHHFGSGHAYIANHSPWPYCRKICLGLVHFPCFVLQKSAILYLKLSCDFGSLNSAVVGNKTCQAYEWLLILAPQGALSSEIQSNPDPNPKLTVVHPAS